MTVLDYIILGTLLIGLVSGLVRGFTRQVFSLGGLVLGVVLGSMLFRPLAQFLSGVVTMQERVAQIVAFVLILLIVPLLCGLLGRLLSKVVHSASLGIVDRLLGALCGLLIWLMVVGLAMQLVEMTRLKNLVKSDDSKSVLYEPVRDISAACLQWTWKKVLDSGIPVKDKKEGEENWEGAQKC